MRAVRQAFLRFSTDADATTAIEYGLIAGIIGTVLLSALAALATRLSTTLSVISYLFPPTG
jgi:Flp pilus assembly pilin Flp